MREQVHIDYDRIAEAIEYIKNNFKSQPSLEEIADQIKLSPFHFQRLFTEWAGISPKKFIQYLSVEHAKTLLRKEQLSIFDTTHETGLSSTGRLHDLFISIEGMTPAEYKNSGKNLSINYCFFDTLFGKIIIGSTDRGICYLAFEEDPLQAIAKLQNDFPLSELLHREDELQLSALRFFSFDWDHLSQLKLHLKGTDFQLKVWNALLRIPMGRLSTYGSIANEISNDKAARAVGTAIGSNPVAFLIPCHRVIQSSGLIGGYMWGLTRKSAIIAWESANIYR